MAHHLYFSPILFDWAHFVYMLQAVIHIYGIIAYKV